MKSRTLLVFFSLSTVFILTIACTGTWAANPAAQSTSVAQTVNAQLTQIVLETVVAQFQLSNTPIIINTPQFNASSTSTNQPTATNTPTPSQTPLPATWTPSQTVNPASATPRPPTATNTPLPCYLIQFVADVSIPDGTILNANTSFTKTWRLKNIGLCTWTADYTLIFDHGTSFSAPATVNLGSAVAPGQTIDLSVNLVTPATGGTYSGYFKLRSNSGVSFALGTNADVPFWVTVNVVAQPTKTSTPDPHAALDFVANRCSASWASSSAVAISCNGSENFSAGSVSYNSAPLIETNYQDDEPALIMIPPTGSNGWITGNYPGFTVQTGDHFSALTGCMANSSNCTVAFTLSYIESGSVTVQTLNTWTETYDGNRTPVDIDLSPLAGKVVQFLLTVGNSNGANTDDRAFWEAAKIIR